MSKRLAVCLRERSKEQKGKAWTFVWPLAKRWCLLCFLDTPSYYNGCASRSRIMYVISIIIYEQVGSHHLSCNYRKHNYRSNNKCRL